MDNAVFERSIYGFLFDVSLFELIIDNEVFTHYIIYTYNNINYKIFISDSLLSPDENNNYASIKFFVNGGLNATNDKFILLAHAEEVPELILTEDNTINTDEFYTYVYKEHDNLNIVATETLGSNTNIILDINNQEDSILNKGEEKIFEYDTIVLTRFDNNNFEDTYNNKYIIHNVNDDLLRRFIRHYKILRRKYNQNDYINVIRNEGVYKVKYLEHTFNEQTENTYIDEGYNTYNEYKDNTLEFDKYHSTEDLESKINNDKSVANHLYMNKILKDLEYNGDFITRIKEIVNNYLNDSYNYFYIRFALGNFDPIIDKSQKEDQTRNIVKIRKIYESNKDYFEQIIKHVDVYPIFNTNKIYAEKKYNYVKNYRDGHFVLDPSSEDYYLNASDNFTVILSKTEYIYNGEEHRPSVTVKNGWKIVNSANYIVEYSNNQDAGVAQVKVTIYEDNYYVEKIINFNIYKAPGYIETYAIGKSIPYSGVNEELITPAIGTGAINYKINNGIWIDSIPSGIDVNTYTIYYKSCETRNYTESNIESVISYITKVDPEYIPPIALNQTYNGLMQDLCTSGSTEHGVIKFSSNNINWYNNIPQRINVGEYTFFWKLDGDNNHNNISSTEITSNILKINLDIQINIDDWYYGEQSKPVNVIGNTYGAIINYSYYNGNDIEFLSPLNSVPTNVGSYIVKADVGETLNYYGTTLTDNFNIKPKQSNIIVPTPKYLTYNGKSQELINSGIILNNNDNSYFEYSLDNIHWSRNIPTGDTAGEYNVYWRVIGDENHSNYEPQTVTVIINKKPINASVYIENSIYGEAFPEPQTTCDLDNLGIEYDVTYIYYDISDTNFEHPLSNIPTNVGEYKLKAIIGETQNYQSKIVTTTFIIKKANLSYDPPIAKPNLVYNKSSQILISPGSCSDGIFYYKIDNSLWSTNLNSIIGINAGKYNVYWKIDGDQNHNGIDTQLLISYINQAPLHYVAPTPINNLVYNDTNQTLIFPGSIEEPGFEFDYSLNGTNWSTELPVGKNSKYYYVYWKIDGDNNYESVDISLVVSFIDKSIAQYTVAPTPKANLVYNNLHQILINPGVTSDGTFKYGISANGPWYDNVNNITAINASQNSYEHRTYWKIVGDINHYDKSIENIITPIAKANPNFISPAPITNIYYDNYWHDLIYAGSTSDGTFYYSLDNENWSTIIPQGQFATTYNVYWKLIGDKNHIDYNPTQLESPITVSINQEQIIYSAPIGKTGLIYNGNSQQLVYPGFSTVGTLKYSLDNWETESTEIPTGINPRTYDVYWKITGDENHADINPNTIIKVSIAKKSLNNLQIVINNWIEGDVPYDQNIYGNDGNGATQIKYYNSTDVNFEHPLQGKPTTHGNYIIQLIVSETDFYDGKTVVNTFEIYKLDVIEPQACTLTYNGNSQELITSGSFRGNSYGAEIQYSTSTNGPWSTNLPTGVNANTYNSYWRVISDRNNVIMGPTLIVTIINKALPQIIEEPVAKNNLVYNGSEQELLTDGRANINGNWTYEKGIDAQTYNNVQWSFTPSDTNNYSSVTGTITSVEITKASYNLSVTLNDWYYGNEPNNPIITCELSTLGIPYTTEITYKQGTTQLSNKPNAIANDYSVTVTVTHNNTNYISPNSATDNFEILDPGQYTAPKPLILTYNGNQQVLIIPGEVNQNVGGTMKYSLSQSLASSWTSDYTQIKGTHVQEYNVYWKVVKEINGETVTIYPTNKDCEIVIENNQKPRIIPASFNLSVTLDDWYKNNPPNDPVVTCELHSLGITDTHTFTYYNTSDTNFANPLNNIPTEIGNYYITVTCTHNNGDYISTKESQPSRFDILDPAEPTEPLGLINLIYNGSPQALIDPNNHGVVDSNMNGIMEYSLDGSTWTSDYTQITATNAGTYDIYWRVMNGNTKVFPINENYGTSHQAATINRKDWNLSMNMDDWYVGDAPNDPVVTCELNSLNISYTQEFTYYNSSNVVISKPIKEAGNEYKVTVRITQNTNANYVDSKTISDSFNILPNTVIAPTAKTLTYNGTTQTLLNPGDTKGHGVMEYSLDNTNWSTTIPTRMDAGNYDTWWRVCVNDNPHTHKIVVPATYIGVNIVKYQITVQVIMDDWTYGSTASDPVVQVNYGSGFTTISSGYTITYYRDNTALSDKPSDAGTYKVVVNIAESTNYLSGTDDDTFTIEKADYNLSVTLADWYKDNPPNDPVVTCELHSLGITDTHTFTYYENSIQLNSKPINTKGTYQVTVTCIHNNTNYISPKTSAKYTFSIQNPGSGTSPKGLNLTYNESQQILISPGAPSPNTPDAVMQYSLTPTNSNSWTSDYTQIKGTNAGTYYVGWRIMNGNTIIYPDDTNYETVTAEISQKTFTLTVSMNDWFEGDTPENPTITCSRSYTLVSYQYKVSTAADNTYTTDKPVCVINTYTVKATILQDANYEGPLEATSTFQIKQNTGFIAPTAITGLVYDSNPHALLNAGNSQGYGVIEYSLNNTTYSTSIPTGTNAGTYNTWWRAYVNGTSPKQIFKGPTQINVTIDTKSIIVTVNIDGWVYGETAKTPVVKVSYNNGTSYTTISSGYTIYYKISTDADSKYTTTKPSKAGTYTIKADVAANGNYKGGIDTNTFTISKANPTYTVPTAKTGLTYSGSAQQLINEGAVNGGTMSYSLNNSSWVTDYKQIKGTDAKNYDVWWKIDGDDDHKDISSTKITNPAPYIGQKSIQVQVTIANWNYNSTPSNPIVQVNYGSGFTTINSGYTITYYNGNTALSGKPSNAGTYTIKADVAANGNYQSGTGTNTFTINTISPTYTVPTAKTGLTYSGSAQELINTGTASGGIMYYKSDNSTWVTDYKQIKGTDAGNYNVYWKIDGDNNHTSISSTAITNPVPSIGQTNTIVNPEPSAKTRLTYTGSSQQLINAGTIVKGGVNCPIQYSFNSNTGYTNNIATISKIDAGTYISYWKVDGDTNYIAIPYKTLSTTISKANPTYTAPVGLELTYNGTSQILINAGTTTGGTMRYSKNESDWYDVINSIQETDVGRYSVYWKIDGDTNYNNKASDYVTAEIKPGSLSISMTSSNNWNKGSITSYKIENNKLDVNEYGALNDNISDNIISYSISGATTSNDMWYIGNVGSTLDNGVKAFSFNSNDKTYTERNYSDSVNIYFDNEIDSNTYYSPISTRFISDGDITIIGNSGYNNVLYDFLGRNTYRRLHICYFKFNGINANNFIYGTEYTISFINNCNYNIYGNYNLCIYNLSVAYKPYNTSNYSLESTSFTYPESNTLNGDIVTNSNEGYVTYTDNEVKLNNLLNLRKNNNDTFLGNMYLLIHTGWSNNIHCCIKLNDYIDNNNEFKINQVIIALMSYWETLYNDGSSNSLIQQIDIAAPIKILEASDINCVGESVSNSIPIIYNYLTDFENANYTNYDNIININNETYLSKPYLSSRTMSTYLHLSMSNNIGNNDSLYDNFLQRKILECSLINTSDTFELICVTNLDSNDEFVNDYLYILYSTDANIGSNGFYKIKTSNYRSYVPHFYIDSNCTHEITVNGTYSADDYDVLNEQTPSGNIAYIKIDITTELNDNNIISESDPIHYNAYEMSYNASTSNYTISNTKLKFLRIYAQFTAS